MPQVCEDMIALSDGAVLWTATSDAPGGGRPGMVFLHGGPGMWDNLGPVAGMVSDSFRTHRYDQRGCGRSSASEDYSLARYVADLEELRRHFGYERRYVFGHSFGRQGPQAPEAQRPADPSTRRARATGPSWDEEVEWRTLSWLPDFVDPLRARDWARTDAETPLRLNLACNRAFNAETGAWSESGEWARWSAVAPPVWLIHGSGDPRPTEGPRALASALPRARFHELPGAGHQPWRERPDLVAEVLATVADHPASQAC